MSYFGWNGRDDLDSVRGLFEALGELKYADIDEGLLIVVRANIGDNLAYTDGLHFCCQEVYPYRNQK